MSALEWRSSAMGRGILIDQGVHVFPKTLERDARRAGEGGEGGFGRYEHPLSHGNQRADRHALARDDKGPPPVEGAHDSPAFVAELSLSNTSAHGPL